MTELKPYNRNDSYGKLDEDEAEKIRLMILYGIPIWKKQYNFETICAIMEAYRK